MARRVLRFGPGHRRPSAALQQSTTRMCFATLRRVSYQGSHEGCTMTNAVKIQLRKDKVHHTIHGTQLTIELAGVRVCAVHDHERLPLNLAHPCAAYVEYRQYIFACISILASLAVLDRVHMAVFTQTLLETSVINSL